MTKKQLIAEMERVDERHLDVVYRVAQSLEASHSEEDTLSWQDFIASTYGCLSEAPIERGEQGEAEIRETLR